jgi:hypothetical protein
MSKGLTVLLGVGAVGGIVAGAAGVVFLVGALKARKAAAAAKK